MGKGNIAIDKSMVKTIVDGKIIIPLPKVLVESSFKYFHFFVPVIRRISCAFWLKIDTILCSP